MMQKQHGQWSVINDVLKKSKRNKEKNETLLTEDGHIVQNPENALNEHYVSVATALATKFVDSIEWKKTMKNKIQNSIFLDNVSILDVILAAKSLKPKSSSGHDDIPTKMITATINSTAPVLTHLLNYSIETSIFPKIFKTAKVIPVEKIRNNTELSNFRPISLLPGFSKLYEKILYNKLMSFFNKYNVISNYQYGFRKNHSTELAVTELIRKIGVASEEKKFTAGIFLDLSKAFDCIDHVILLNKLEHYGVRGKSLMLMKSYLSDRKQFVRWKQKDSKLQKISIGVPQGSILGPLLFTIYINDLPISLKFFEYVMYADDTNLFRSDKNINELLNNINQNISQIVEWFFHNRLTLNKNKTQLMIFGPVQYLNYKEPYKIMVGDQTVIETKTLKFLGIIIDSKLSFKYHINSVSTKITQALGAINRIKYFLPLRSLNLLYNSLCVPHLVYANIIWASTYSSLTAPLRIIMKKAMRLITRSKYSDSTEKLFTATNNFDFYRLHKYLSVIFVFKQSTGILPEIFKNYYQFGVNKRHNNIIKCNKSKTNIVFFHIVCNGARIWNDLIFKNDLNSILSYKTLSGFKKKLKVLLIN